MRLLLNLPLICPLFLEILLLNLPLNFLAAPLIQMWQLCLQEAENQAAAEEARQADRPTQGEVGGLLLVLVPEAKCHVLQPP